MFNPVTFKVRDSTGRGAYRQWWGAWLGWPILLVFEVAFFAHPWRPSLWFWDALIFLGYPVMTLWAVARSISKLEDRPRIWIMQGLAVLLGVILGTWLYHPDGMFAPFETQFASYREGYVSPEDWITRGRLPAAILVGVVMVVFAVVARRRFQRRQAVVESRPEQGG